MGAGLSGGAQASRPKAALRRASEDLRGTSWEWHVWDATILSGEARVSETETVTKMLMKNRPSEDTKEYVKN